MSVPRLAALLVPLTLAALGSAQTVTLRFKPPVGKTVNYVTVMSMVQNVPGMATPMGFTQTMPMTYRVLSRANGSTVVQKKTGQVKVDMPAGSPMAAQKAMIEKRGSGVTSTMTIDEFGGFKNMTASGASGAAMSRQIGGALSAGAQGIVYPARALKVGDSWGSSLDMSKMVGVAAPMGMKATGKIPITYRLVGIEKRGGMTLAKIAMTMKGTTSMTMGGAGAPGGKSMAMAMTMNSTGTLLMDAGTGLLQSMSSSTDTGMAIMGQNMKQRMTMTMTAK